MGLAVYTKASRDHWAVRSSLFEVTHADASSDWDDLGAEFSVEERLYDEVFRLRRRLWIERAGVFAAAFAFGWLIAHSL
jgi:hypothetical protein